MFEYFISNIFLSVIWPFVGRRIVFVVVMAMSLLLYNLPTTGDDYDFYKIAYESAVWQGSYPFVITSGLTAERGFKIYLWLAKTITLGSSFEFFLVFNFWLCFLVYYYALKNMVERIPVLNLSILISVVLFFPTIFYFSPRSSLSFVLVFLSVSFLVKANRSIFFSIMPMLLAVLVHSQYIPVVILLMTSVIMVRVVGLGYRPSVALICVVPCVFVLVAAPSLQSILYSIPGMGFLAYKLHYFIDESAGPFRVTALLSVVIFPLLYFMSFNRSKVIKCELKFYVLLLIVFGAVVNVAFYDNAHVSGRISRFSDFFLISVLLPVFLNKFFFESRALLSAVVVFLSVISIYLYPTLYNFDIRVF